MYNDIKTVWLNTPKIVWDCAFYNQYNRTWGHFVKYTNREYQIDMSTNERAVPSLCLTQIPVSSPSAPACVRDSYRSNTCPPPPPSSSSPPPPPSFLFSSPAPSRAFTFYYSLLAIVTCVVLCVQNLLCCFTLCYCCVMAIYFMLCYFLCMLFIHLYAFVRPYHVSSFAVIHLVKRHLPVPTMPQKFWE